MQQKAVCWLQDTLRKEKIRAKLSIHSTHMHILNKFQRNRNSRAQSTIQKYTIVVLRSDTSILVLVLFMLLNVG